MMIEWLVMDEGGRDVASGSFHDGSPRGRNRFATRMREAWEDGHAVISRKVEEGGRRRRSSLIPAPLPKERDVRIEETVPAAVEDVARVALVDASPDPDPVDARGSATVYAVILWTLAVGGAGFLFGAAWRGAQMVGG